MEKNIFIFDQNKCVGCHACVVACMNENGFQSPDQWRNIHKSQDYHFPSLPLFYLSLACNHCDDSPCLKNCPALAYSQDKKTGAIIHDPDKCIGCKYCTWACPFDAPKYNPKKGIIEKCTFCNHRIEENLKPACANLCPTGALDFSHEEFSREDSIDSGPIPVNIGSHIRINKLRNVLSPEMDLSLFKNQSHQITRSEKHQKISAKEECPLLIFTLLSAILVSIYVSLVSNSFNSMDKLIYIGFVAIAALLSMLHLGQKSKAWRSLTNIKNSWLSREIALFSLFFTGVFIDFYLFDLPNIIISAIGILFLISIDMLYSLATWKWPIKIHSAQTLLIGITLFTILTNKPTAFLIIITLRTILYLYRQKAYHKLANIIPYLRISMFVLAYISILSNITIIISILPILIGEIIDRMEFYNELNIPDPKIEFAKK